MLKVFIGFDQSEAVAYHVLCQSILTRASGPVAITPLVRTAIPGFTRLRGPLDSTDFSNSRFTVPMLCDYGGRAIYMDCDMLVRVDLYELLFDLKHDPDKAVWVVKHEYVPQGGQKMDGRTQTRYYRKNWSSFVCFDNRRCKVLTPEYVNTTHGLALHQFDWLRDDEIGSLPKKWNYLVGEDGQTAETPAVIHYTRGGPWLAEYGSCEHAGAWRVEAERTGLVPASSAYESPTTATAL